MLEVEEQLLPRSCALAHAVGEADQLLLALRCGANNDQQALRIVSQPGLNMNAVDPEMDVALGREVALAQARVLFRPRLLETPYGRGRKPAGVLAKQRNERLLEVAGGDPLEVEDRDQHFEALRSARVGRQNRRGKANALRTFTDAVAHPRAAHADRTDAGHDLALWQMAVAHQPLAAIIGRLVGVPTEQGRDLSLDSDLDNGRAHVRASYFARCLPKKANTLLQPSMACSGL